MPPETTDKLSIDYTDLQTRKVENRLREQEALARNRRQADQQTLAADIEPAGRGGGIWYNSVVFMAVFGLVGGLLAWGGGELFRFRTDPKTEAAAWMQDISRTNDLVTGGRLSAADAAAVVDGLKQEAEGNPYFAVYVDTSLSDADKDAKLTEVDRREAVKTFIANVLSFGTCGMLIAACLAVAEPIVDRNRIGAIVNGTVGASIGLLGGVIVSLFVERLYNLLLGQPLLHGSLSTGRADLPYQQILARSLTWGVLGLFLMIGPGVVMRNGKKLAIGLVGGAVGGLIGGALFDPVAAALNGNTHWSRGVALVAIGAFAGGLTGLIENAAKSGWLKVTAGLIAGKQFILYRNPTFIGSGPECQIYLFRDAKVGRRHAAVHIVPGGFEIENLPLGATTLINGKATDGRKRLRNNDVIQIGSSAFRFQEKAKEEK